MHHRSPSLSRQTLHSPFSLDVWWPQERPWPLFSPCLLFPVSSSCTTLLNLFSSMVLHTGRSRRRRTTLARRAVLVLLFVFIWYAGNRPVIVSDCEPEDNGWLTFVYKLWTGTGLWRSSAWSPCCSKYRISEPNTTKHVTDVSSRALLLVQPIKAPINIDLSTEPGAVFTYKHTLAISCFQAASRWQHRLSTKVRTMFKRSGKLKSQSKSCVKQTIPSLFWNCT